MSDLTRIPQNIDYHIHEIDSVDIASWTPERDGKGVCTQVHIECLVKGFQRPLVLRMKSRRVVQELVEALTFHMNDVWPTPTEGAPYE